MQMLGDFIASIMPDMKPLFDALKPQLETVGRALATIAPLLQGALQTSITVLASIIGVLVDVFKAAADALAYVGIGLLKMIPSFVSDDLNKLQENLEKFVSGEDLKMAKTSRGAAGQGASYVGIGDLTKSAILAGLGGGKGPAEETADATKKTAEGVGNIFGALARLAGGLVKPAEEARGENPT
jgi:hypothetical protein